MNNKQTSPDQLFDFDSDKKSQILSDHREVSFLQLSDDTDKLLRQLNVLLHQALVNFANEKYEDMWEQSRKLLESYRLKLSDGVRLAKSKVLTEKESFELTHIELEMNKLPIAKKKAEENKMLKIIVGIVSLLGLLLIAWFKRNS
jgi:hypothetical protein